MQVVVGVIVQDGNGVQDDGVDAVLVHEEIDPDVEPVLVEVQQPDALDQGARRECGPLEPSDIEGQLQQTEGRVQEL